MNGCYCSNYYGSIGCRNVVSKFGERCKLCVALKSGASLSHGLLSDDDLWMVSKSSSSSSNSSSSDPRPSMTHRSDSWWSTYSGGGSTSTRGAGTRTTYAQK